SRSRPSRAACWMSTLASRARPGGRPSPAAEPRPGPSRTDRCHPAIVFGYGVAGLAVVLLAGLTTQIAQVPVSAQLGLFQMLPPSYWAGIALIVLSAILSVWTR